MSIYSKRFSLLLISFTLGLLLAASPAIAEQVPLADGKLWTESTQPEKVAYIVGLNNYMVMEYVSQVEDGNPPPTSDQSPTPEFWKGSEGVTINQAIAALDDFYAKNPGKMETPCIVVLWNELIEPRLK